MTVKRLTSLGTRRGFRLAVGLLALTALFGLDAIYVLHFAAEAACGGMEAGDPYDCFVCTGLFTMGLDVPPPATMPPPAPGRLLAPPDDVAVAPHILTHHTGARAPPAISV